jgi:NADH-quinone oxidoreductase subunit H
MKELADRIIVEWLGQQPAQWEWTWAVYLLLIVIAAVIVLTFVSVFAGPITVVERRVAGRIMSRIGPNRVGPQGALQWLADGVKCFLKEDLVPGEADRPLFRLAPYLVFSGMFAAFVVLPFGANLVAADLNVGLLYVFGITSLVVVGILMAGWSSNSKWALFGGVRSAAQIVSYEIPTALGLMCVVLIAGSLSTQEVIRAQGGMPWDWFLFRSPFTFAAFFLFFTAAIAEGNRTPFDLPEAESELVAGYLTEYSGMRYLFFMFAEWANLWIMAAMATICFLGGWQIPGVSPEMIEASGWSYGWWQFLSFLIFAAKTLVLVMFVIQLRWTVPRLRVDHLMAACWKYLVPLTLVCVVGVACWVVFVPEGGIVDLVVRAVMTLIGLAIVVQFIRRVRFNYSVDRDKYKEMTGKELWYPPYRLP